MRQAIAIAKQNPKAPFGCVLVHKETGRVVGRGVNNSRSNPVLHGEIVALVDYANTVGEAGDPWPPLRLYTTAEPCCMCQAAILWSGIQEVYFGTSISRLSELGWRQIPIGAAEVAERTTFIDCRVTGGVLASECDELFRVANGPEKLG